MSRNSGDDDSMKTNPKHPYGISLLARDTPENRATWGADGLGYVDIVEPPEDCDENENQQCPHYHYKDDDPTLHPDTAAKTPIHLLIASFRDRLCPRTLHNAWSKAKHPERIYIRLVDQNIADSDIIDDAPCWKKYCETYNPNCQAEFGKNIYVYSMDASESKGPTDARSKLSAMISHDYRYAQHAATDSSSSSLLLLTPVHLQDFCMQTDSHMDFSDDWDIGLMSMFHRAKNDYAVLSTYVTDISENNKDPPLVPNLCMVQFTTTIRNWGTKECKWLRRPKLTNAMWGAGLSFHRCHAELNVPVDPYTTNVFDGEEGSRGIRFFSHGYDVYTPDKVLVTHDYHGHQSNPVVHTWGASGERRLIFDKNMPLFLKESEDQRSKVSSTGTKRVNLLLGIDEPVHLTPAQQATINLIRNSRYGLGNKRNLTQIRDFTGINLRERRMEVNKCGNLEWVPFEEIAANYGVAETLSRGMAGEVIQPFVIESNVGEEATASGGKVGLLKAARSLEAHALAALPPVSQTSTLEIGLGAFVVVAILVKLATWRMRQQKQKSRFE
ncbi:hypothetical protein MPSEU_000466500 [Mayamaea pseudoterrestris]|nr:hypothetical protein MPSEU_000465800 [Mayamaea pseudoterrestris]GKY95019.1 hypothetical protein MPSEU_000466500 [Mayamaea pseudoterrestris]